MNEPKKGDPPPKASEENVDSGTATGSPNVTAPDGSSSQPGPAAKLTPEEQMALYEKELKEDDWGHQPC